jgi:hypothetical protein
LTNADAECLALFSKSILWKGRRLSSKKLIRDSTAEFLMFTGKAGEQSIEARYENDTVWLTQKLMAALFALDVRTISEHLNNIYEAGEIQREATIRKFRTVQTDGAREVGRNIDFSVTNEKGQQQLISTMLIHLVHMQNHMRKAFRLPNPTRQNPQLPLDQMPQHSSILIADTLCD